MGGKQNQFEKYPALAKWMEQLANADIEGLSLAAWNDFCYCVNSALESAEINAIENYVTALQRQELIELRRRG